MAKRINDDMFIFGGFKYLEETDDFLAINNTNRLHMDQVNVVPPEEVLNYGNNPATFDLYPNPSPGLVTINYTVPESSGVSISVYDMAGRRVEVLINSLMKSCYYTLEWNIEKYRAGIYYCTLTIESYYLQAAKVAVMK